MGPRPRSTVWHEAKIMCKAIAEFPRKMARGMVDTVAGIPFNFAQSAEMPFQKVE
jgi:hypothetical protein